MPSADEITEGREFLAICDRNTAFIVDKIFGSNGLTAAGKNICVLEPGEKNKTWQSAEAILKSASRAGLGRDSVFIGIGGGVITDLCAFAASIYMRGVSVRLISTTLLGMVDASIGGKTGFDLFGIKNLAGTFYPAEKIYMPISCLQTLPGPEWKSGMAELIKTAILADNDFLNLAKTLKNDKQNLGLAISKAVQFKGRIAEEDPKESGTGRVLLNLGHTFGHALESSAGFGNITHGEAIAWGIARACEMGQSLGITPKERADEILEILSLFDYETKPQYPGMDREKFLSAITSDKKKKSGKLIFIVPAKQGARIIEDSGYIPKNFPG